MNKSTNKFRNNNDNNFIFITIIGIVASLIITLMGYYYLESKIKIVGFSGVEDSTKYKYHYAFIVENNNDSFWETVFKAAKKEGQKQDVLLEQFGLGISEKESVNERMKLAIAAGVDGILVNPINEETNIYIDEAVKKGIFVGTIMNDSIKGSRNCFVGVNSYNLGQEYGKQIVMNLKGGMKDVMVLVDSDQDVSAQNIISTGIKDALVGYNLNIILQPIDKSNTFSAEEIIRNTVLKEDVLPDVLVCLSYQDTLCAYQAVVDYNKVGSVCIIGSSQSEDILRAISNHIVTSVVAIDAQQMGEKAMQALVEYQNMGRVNEYQSIDTYSIDASNVNKYIGLKEEEADH